ncbi:hypothetical protein wTpre_533 [Wolbachia endosymbiont of Trichogramma pretiosum]|nr:hypothetical protein wTpre_533 [Wolbachia endosymbiont of Trichogramma pretiosum]
MGFKFETKVEHSLGEPLKVLNYVSVLCSQLECICSAEW